MTKSKILLIMIICFVSALVAEEVDNSKLDYDFSSKTYSVNGSPFTGVSVVKNSQGKVMRRNTIEKGFVVETIMYLADGKKSSHARYKNNKKHGLQIAYSLSDGSLYKKVNYNMGKKEGLYETYHPNGKINIKTTYKNNKRSGEFISYRSNGKMGYKGAYTDGKKSGKWTWYKSDGSVSRTKEY